MEMMTLNCIFNEQVRDKYPELKVTEEDQDEVKQICFSQHMENLSKLFLNNISEYYSQEKQIQESTDDFYLHITKKKQSSRGFVYEFQRIFERNLIISQRNPKVLFFKVFQNIFTAILVSIIFKNVKLIFNKF